MTDGADVDRLEAVKGPGRRQHPDLVAVPFDKGPSKVVNEPADAVRGRRRVGARQKEDLGHRAGISPQAGLGPSRLGAFASPWRLCEKHELEDAFLAKTQSTREGAKVLLL